jgi:putative heme-binding domain-containing protein
VTDGGIIYQGGAFPEKFNGAYIAGNLLANAVYWHELEPNGSSFKGHFGGVLLATDDIWFRPVDCTIGPDGAVYVADWYDKRATHVDSIDTWDRSNGRIYKIEAKGTKPVPNFDLAKLSSVELVKLLGHPNDWFRREARQILAERRDAKVIPILKQNILGSETSRLALQSLWTLQVVGGFDEAFAKKLLKHPEADVRTWTIRLVGDSRVVSPAIQNRLVELARTDSSPLVRNQLACSARRWPGKVSLLIIRELLQRTGDADDPQIPLLIWWAIESKAVSDRDQVVELLRSPAMWQKPLVQQHMVERVARRYAAEGTDDGFASCAQLLSWAPTNADAERALKGMELALSGRRLERVPRPLADWFTKAWQQKSPGTGLIHLGLRLGNAEARQAALKLIASETASDPDRASLMDVLAQMGASESVPVLLAIVEKSKSVPLQNAAMAALQRFPDKAVAQSVVALYPRMHSALRQRARNALCSRPVWAMALLDAVDAAQISQSELSLDQVRQMVSLKDAELSNRVERRWGKIQPASDEEKENTLNRLRLVLNPSGAAGRSGKGDPAAGKLLFQQTCSACHLLFGEGATIGPDLTSADRKNTEVMLINILNPSAYIRPEYVSYDLTTRDDQSLAGLMVESSPASVTVLDRNNQRHVLARDQIKDLNPSAVSLMPEGLLEALTPQQVMDLFAYLQSDGPVGSSAAAK